MGADDPFSLDTIVPIPGATVGPPSLRVTQEAIAKVRRLNLSALSIDEIKIHIWGALDNAVLRTPEAAMDQAVFRARVFKVTNPPEFLADIGAPPPNASLRDQRCSRAGQSMFYCTTSRAAALWECHAKLGDHVAVSKWRLNRACRLSLAGYTEEAFWRLGANRDLPNVDIESETDANKAIRTFLAEIFSIDVKEWRTEWYKLTIAITEILIGDGTFGGLMYPTIAMSARADNLALRPEFVADGLRFVSAKYVVVTGTDGTSINVDTLDFAPGVLADGRLDWKGRMEQWILAKDGDALKFTAENGERVARDLEGNIVEPQ